ncbi:hypothetical protein UFOVP17_54 [uncultured Caudovirales phage]|uniref:Uncharacterized protein n=1 Tax=uncultured Caudovirales phage TaxID=2100421 RepID=A0A6J5KIV6_9CAUD|nr:hypothetical protein UFOVP17_54 [uncultured Caudovirales phage]
MTKYEALKMAIKELSQTALGDTPALKACKEALEQQDENDQHWYNEGYGQGKFDALMDAELAQEPSPMVRHKNGNFSPAPVWQGLSDDEICDLWTLSDKDIDGIDLGYTTQQHYFAALVEQALKEKNSG